MPRGWVLAAPAPQACRRHLGADIGPALGVTWGTLVAEEGGAKLQVSPSQCDGVVRSPFRKAGQGVSEAQGLWIMHRRHISVLPRGSRFAGETGASYSVCATSMKLRAQPPILRFSRDSMQREGRQRAARLGEHVVNSTDAGRRRGSRADRAENATRPLQGKGQRHHHRKGGEQVS